MTNSEKFAAYKAEFDRRFIEKLKSMFPSGIPKSYFIVNKDYKPEEVAIKEWLYGFFVYHSKRVTNVEVEKARQKAESDFELNTANVRILSDRNNIALRDVDGKFYSWSMEAAEIEASRREQLYKPREGHRPCTYCGKQRKPEDLIQRSVISPNWRSTGYKSPPRDYCKDDSCAGNDQMAHEG